MLNKIIKKIKGINHNNLFDQLIELSFCAFCLTLTFPIRKIIYNDVAYATGLFSEFTTLFIEINELFLGLTLLLFGLALITNNTKKLNPEAKSTGLTIYLILLSLIVISGEMAILFAEDRFLAFGGWLKIIETISVIIFLYQYNFSWNKLAKIFLIIALFQGGMGIGQFINNSDLGLSLIGEQPLNPHSAGVAKITLNDQSQIRAVGTFLHPNILACYLVITFFLTGNLTGAWRYLRYLLIIPLLLTFSRTGYLAFIASALFSKNIFKNIFKHYLIIIIVIITVLAWPNLAELIWSRAKFDVSLTERLELMNISKDLLLNYPGGFGYKNFILKIPEITDNLYIWQLQPVHNIFLLIANEAGIIASLSLMIGIGLLFIKNNETGTLLITIIIFGLSDHFLITIHVGLMLLAIVIAKSLHKKPKNLNHIKLNFSDHHKNYSRILN